MKKLIVGFACGLLGLTVAAADAWSQDSRRGNSGSSSRSSGSSSRGSSGSSNRPRTSSGSGSSSRTGTPSGRTGSGTRKSKPAASPFGKTDSKPARPKQPSTTPSGRKPANPFGKTDRKPKQPRTSTPERRPTRPGTTRPATNPFAKKPDRTPRRPDTRPPAVKKPANPFEKKGDRTPRRPDTRKPAVKKVSNPFAKPSGPKVARKTRLERKHINQLKAAYKSKDLKGKPKKDLKNYLKTGKLPPKAKKYDLSLDEQNALNDYIKKNNITGLNAAVLQKLINNQPLSQAELGVALSLLSQGNLGAKVAGALAHGVLDNLPVVGGGGSGGGDSGWMPFPPDYNPDTDFDPGTDDSDED